MADPAAYLTPEQLQYQIEHINDDRSTEIIASCVIVAFLATGAVVLRVACRRHMKLPLSWDDHTIIAALVSIFPPVKVGRIMEANRLIKAVALGMCFLEGYSMTALPS